MNESKPTIEEISEINYFHVERFKRSLNEDEIKRFKFLMKKLTPFDCIGTLLEQIELLRKAENSALVRQVLELEKELELLRKVVQLQREGLEFYSDLTEDGLDWDRVNAYCAIQDKGKYARQTLKQVDELFNAK